MRRNMVFACEILRRRTFIPVVFVVVVTLAAFCHPRSAAGEPSRIFLPDFLPANTILCVVPPDDAVVDKDYSRTLFARLANLPEMGPFLRSFEESRRTIAKDLSETANVPSQLAQDLVSGRLGVALMNVGLGRDGKPTAEFALGIALRSVPDRKAVYNAVMSLLNKPEVVRQVLQSQGIDPNTPLRSLAQEETVPGGPPILRIGPNFRVMSIGNMVMIYHGPGSDGIRKVFEAVQNPTAALSRNANFQASYRGAEGKPGSNFFYVNVPRVMAILDALNLNTVSRVADALGLGSVQSIGVSGTFHDEGVRQTMFLHTPGGSTTGLMSALIPMPADSLVGMESFANIIPSPARSFLAMRVDVTTLLKEIPYIIDSFDAVTRPGGVSGMVANERILNVPVTEILQALGSDIVVRPHDDTQVLMFHNVDVAAFESVIARMEQSAGVRFNTQNIGGYMVRYMNRRSSLTTPIAPAFCLMPRGQGSPQGIVYMASHPQALVSLIREASSAREPLAGTPDFRKASGGIGNGYSLYYYNGDLECYRRVYNFLLPVLSLWSSSTKYPVDTGLLPTASTIVPAMFGSACGIRFLPDGMQMQGFSPIGSGAVIVQILDKLVVSNPLVIGYAYSMLETWMKTLPTW